MYTFVLHVLFISGRVKLLIFVALLHVPGVLCLGTTILEGELYVQLIVSGYKQAHENGTCTEVEAGSIQNVEAVKWTYSNLNSISYLPLRIGKALISDIETVNILLTMLLLVAP